MTHLFAPRPGLLHRYVTPWECTGGVKLKRGLFGLLSVRVEQQRFVSTSLFGRLAWKPQARWRRCRHADIPHIQGKLESSRAAMFGFDLAKAGEDRTVQTLFSNNSIGREIFRHRNIK